MTDWLQVRKQGRRERERGYGYGYGDGGKGRQRHKDTSVWMARSHPQEREWRSRASLPHPAPFLPSPPKPTYASPCALELGSRGATGPGRAGPEVNCRDPSIPNGRLRLPPRAHALPPYQHPTILLHNTTQVNIGAACLSFIQIIQSYNSLHGMQFGGRLL